MKKTILGIYIALLSISIYAQDENVAVLSPTGVKPIATEKFDDTIPTPKRKDFWKFSGVAGLNISQAGFWNWAAGGNNNANGRVFANLTLAYKKDNLSWITNLDTEFGMMYTPTTSFTWRKPNDKIVFSSKFGYEFSKTWFITVMGGFSSQYAKGYEYKTENGIENETYISNWLSPSYTDLSVGIDWQPNKIFTVYLSPIAGRLTSCTEEELRSKYGVPQEETFLPQLGMTLKAGVNYSPVKGLMMISTMTLYTPYTSKVQKFGNIDVNWDFSISYQFLKVLNVSLGTSLIYHDQVKITDRNGNTGARVQFKEVLGVGVSYMF